MKSFIIAAGVWCSAAVFGQEKGVPLPGLKESERESAPAESDRPVPGPPDIPALRQQASSGDAAAQCRLADLILRGSVRDARPGDAAALLEKAAESGSREGQFSYARLLMAGQDGVKSDPERSRFLLQQSAEAGYPPAQAAWGFLLESAIDPKSRDLNYSEPIAWYRKAIAGNDPEGMCRLALLLASGRVTDADHAESWSLLKRAASLGHPLALNECGAALQAGKGAEKDPVAAVGYFTAAAELGLPAALFNLGRCFREGVGVPVNADKAGAAFSAAAKQNFAPAQLMLGEIFERGEGTKPNPVAAAINYHLAGRNGLPEGTARAESLTKKLTRDQAAEVQKAVTEAGKPDRDSKGKGR